MSSPSSASTCALVCAYGSCNRDNICECNRGFFNHTSNMVPNNTTFRFRTNELCNTSIADHYPMGWLSLQIIFGTLYLCCALVSCVYLYRLYLERKLLMKKRRSSMRKIPPCCSLRVTVFLLLAVATVSRCIWIVRMTPFSIGLHPAKSNFSADIVHCCFLLCISFFHAGIGPSWRKIHSLAQVYRCNDATVVRRPCV